MARRDSTGEKSVVDIEVCPVYILTVSHRTGARKPPLLSERLLVTAGAATAKSKPMAAKPMAMAAVAKAAVNRMVVS